MKPAGALEHAECLQELPLVEFVDVGAEVADVVFKECDIGVDLLEDG